MADLPKRVWSGKKQVYSWKKPVWVKDWKLWVYDPNFKEVTNWQYYSPNRWGNVSSDAELQIYDDKDSLNPTDIGTFEDWLSSTYQFVDWNGTVLKSWTVKDWETPVAPADPTREHYTFTGWNPTVWPINKNTTYSAVYAIDTFTVTFTVNDQSYGSVSPSSIANVPYGESITVVNNTITIGETTVTATAETWYQFSSWGTLPETVTENLTITATFELEPVTITLVSKIDCYDTDFFTITPNTINANIGDTITLAQDFTNITIGEQVAAVRGNVNDEVYFQTVDGEVTACFHGAIPTSCTQKLPTESALPATVAWNATFFFDCPSSWPVGGLQLAYTTRDSTLVDGCASITWTGGAGDIISISPVNVDISWATTISLSNPTLSAWLTNALAATVSSGKIELEIDTLNEWTYTGNVEFDFVVDGFTMARVLVYLNVTVDGSSY